MKAISAKVFKQIIDKQLPDVIALIPMNYKLEKVYVVGQNHRIILEEKKKNPNDEPLAISSIDSGRKNFKIYFNKDGSEWKADILEVQIFGALCHEFEHVVVRDVAEIAENQEDMVKKIIEKIEEDCCISVERIANWAWEIKQAIAKQEQK